MHNVLMNPTTQKKSGRPVGHRYWNRLMDSWGRKRRLGEVERATGKHTLPCKIGRLWELQEPSGRVRGVGWEENRGYSSGEPAWVNMADSCVLS